MTELSKIKANALRTAGIETNTSSPKASPNAYSGLSRAAIQAFVDPTPYTSMDLQKVDTSYGMTANFGKGVFDYSLGLLPILDGKYDYISPTTTSERIAYGFGMFGGFLGSTLATRGATIAAAGRLGLGALRGTAELARFARNIPGAGRFTQPFGNTIPQMQQQIMNFGNSPVLINALNRLGATGTNVANTLSSASKIGGGQSRRAGLINVIRKGFNQSGKELARGASVLSAETALTAHAFDMDVMTSALYTAGGIGGFNAIRGMWKRTPFVTQDLVTAGQAKLASALSKGTPVTAQQAVETALPGFGATPRPGRDALESIFTPLVDDAGNPTYRSRNRVLGKGEKPEDVFNVGFNKGLGEMDLTEIRPIFIKLQQATDELGAAIKQLDYDANIATRKALSTITGKSLIDGRSLSNAKRAATRESTKVINKTITDFKSKLISRDEFQMMLQGRTDKAGIDKSIDFENLIVVTEGNAQKIKNLIKGELEGANITNDVRQATIKNIHNEIDNVLITEARAKTGDLPKGQFKGAISPAEEALVGGTGIPGVQGVINQARIKAGKAYDKSIDKSGKKVKTGGKPKRPGRRFEETNELENTKIYTFATRELVDDITNSQHKAEILLPQSATKKAMDEARKIYKKEVDKIVKSYYKSNEVKQATKKLHNQIVAMAKLDLRTEVGKNQLKLLLENVENIRGIVQANKILSNSTTLERAFTKSLDAIKSKKALLDPDLPPTPIQKAKVDYYLGQSLQIVNKTDNNTILNNVNTSAFQGAKKSKDVIRKNTDAMKRIITDWAEKSLGQTLAAANKENPIIQKFHSLYVELHKNPVKNKEALEQLYVSFANTLINQTDDTVLRALFTGGLNRGATYLSRTISKMVYLIQAATDPKKLRTIQTYDDLSNIRKIGELSETQVRKQAKMSPYKTAAQKELDNKLGHTEVVAGVGREIVEDAIDIPPINELSLLKKLWHLLRSTSRVIETTMFQPGIAWVNQGEIATRAFQRLVSRGGELTTRLEPLKKLKREMKTDEFKQAEETVRAIDSKVMKIIKANPQKKMSNVEYNKLIQPKATEAASQILAGVTPKARQYAEAYRKFMDDAWEDYIVTTNKQVNDSIMSGEQLNMAGKVLTATEELPLQIPFYYPHMRVGNWKLTYVVDDTHTTLGFFQNSDDAAARLADIGANAKYSKGNGRFVVTEVDGSLTSLQSDLPELYKAIQNTEALSGISTRQLLDELAQGNTQAARDSIKGKINMPHLNSREKTSTALGIQEDTIDVATAYMIKAMRHHSYQLLAYRGNTAVSMARNFRNKAGDTFPEVANLLSAKMGELFGRPYGAELQIDKWLKFIGQGIDSTPAIGAMFRKAGLNPRSLRLRKMVQTSLTLSRISTLGLNVGSALLQTTMLPFSVFPAFGVKGTGKLLKHTSNFMFKRTSKTNPELAQALDDIGIHIGITDEGHNIATFAARDLTSELPTSQRNMLLQAIEDGSLWLFNKGDRLPRRVAAAMAHDLSDEVLGNLVKKLEAKGTSIEKISADEIFNIYQGNLAKNMLGMRKGKLGLNTAEWNMLKLIRNYGGYTKFGDEALSAKNMYSKVATGSGKKARYTYKITNENFKKNYMIQMANDTNFIYSTLENPGMLNHPLLKPAAQFKVFTTKYFERFFGMAFRSNEEFYTTVAAFALIAGPLNVPGARDMLQIFDIFLPGKLVNNTEDYLASTMGSFGYAGIPGLLGIDFSRRASVGTVSDLAFKGILTDQQPAGIFAQGLYESTKTAINHFRTGGDSLGWATIYPVVPQSIKNLIDAYDMSIHGETYNYNKHGQLKMPGEMLEEIYKQGAPIGKVGRVLLTAAGLKSPVQGRYEQLLQNLKDTDTDLKFRNSGVMSKASRLVRAGKIKEADALLQENGIDPTKFKRWYKRNQQGAYQQRLRSISKDVRKQFTDR
tara:strand:- start:12157 stop:17934 length:5778 start_codon:yes stop_codon:yes gene_type:complete